jgi:type IV pilus assembly protein PilN
MARINLLPWREELRQQKRVEYLTIVGICAVIAAGVWGAVHLHFNERINYQNSRNAYLEDQISLLDKKIEQIKTLEKEKDRLLSRMKAIETLQTSRPIIVHVFDELVETLPDGVYIKSIDQKGSVITIQGVAQSNARVSNFMRNVEKSEWMKEPNLNVIETSSEDGRRTANFTLKVKQTTPTADQKKEEDV